MSNRVLVVFGSIFSLLFCHSILGQFTDIEISQRPLIEKLLKEARIVKHEEIGEGVTKPLRLYLEAEDFELSAAWKNPSGIQGGHLEGWQYEIAAYEMDKLLELDMIPPTVERRFKGDRGSLQFWVASEMSDLERMEKGIDIPAAYVDNWRKRKYLTRAFDSLIANEDRTQQNIRYTSDWRFIIIDHSRSFRSRKRYTIQLMYGKNGIKGEQLFRQLPRKFVESIRALTFEKIKTAVGDYLKDYEIEAVLERKRLLLAEIEEMIREQGEDAVLY